MVKWSGRSAILFFLPPLGYFGPLRDIPSESAFQPRPQGGICLTNETFERLAREKLRQTLSGGKEATEYV